MIVSGKKRPLPKSVLDRTARVKARTSDNTKSTFDWKAHLTPKGAGELFQKLKGRIGRTLSKSRRALYDDLAMAVVVGRWLASNPKQWDEFWVLDAWQNVGKPPKASDIDLA